MVRRAPEGATSTRSNPRTRRVDPPGSTRPSRLSRWLVDALDGLGWPWCATEEPRIDADSVLRLYPTGPTEAQADSLRALMAPAEYRRLPIREVRR